MVKSTELKVPLELTWNTTLLIIVFTVFGLIATIKPELFQVTALTIQMVLSIPMLTASSMVRIKQVTMDHNSLDKYGHFSFLVGYALVINSTALVLSHVVSYPIALIFLLMNILIPILYSYVLIKNKLDTLNHRIGKDVLFIVMLVVFGLFLL